MPVSNLDASTFLEKYYAAKWLAQNPAEKGRLLDDGRKTDGALALLNEAWGAAQTNFFSIDFQDSDLKQPYWQQSWFPPSNGKYDDFELIKELYRHHYFTSGVPEKWRAFLKEKSWNTPGPSDILAICEGSASPELLRLWSEFKAERVPASPAVPLSMRSLWTGFLKGDDARKLLKLDDKDNFTVETYNRLSGSNYKSLRDIPFPLPANAPRLLATLWDEFVKNRYLVRLTTVDATPDNARLYHDFLKDRFKNIQYLNKILGSDKKTWEEFELTSAPPEGKAQEKIRSVWFDFVKSLPVERRTLHSSERAFQEYLLAKYGSVEKVNDAYGWKLNSIEEAFPPFDAAYAVTFADNQWPHDAQAVLRQLHVHPVLSAQAGPRHLRHHHAHRHRRPRDADRQPDVRLRPLEVQPPRQGQDHPLPPGHDGLPGDDQRDPRVPPDARPWPLEHLPRPRPAGRRQRHGDLHAQGLLRQPAAGALRGRRHRRRQGVADLPDHHAAP